MRLDLVDDVAPSWSRYRTESSLPYWFSDRSRSEAADSAPGAIVDMTGAITSDQPEHEHDDSQPLREARRAPR